MPCMYIQEPKGRIKCDLTFNIFSICKASFHQLHLWTLLQHHSAFLEHVLLFHTCVLSSHHLYTLLSGTIRHYVPQGFTQASVPSFIPSMCRWALCYFVQDRPSNIGYLKSITQSFSLPSDHLFQSIHYSERHISTDVSWYTL